MKVNYHTHTSRCMHAFGTDEEYVLAAIQAGFTRLGFSDHAPWSYDSDFVSMMRMPMSELQDYLTSIRQLKEKYKDQIEIYVGLEYEYFPKYFEQMKNIVRENKLDYIIFGNHYNQTDELHDYFGSATKEEKLYEYLETTIQGIESGEYAYLAHPDLYMRNYPIFDDTCREIAHAICKCAKEHDFILEYNLGGVSYSKNGKKSGYPCKEFWEIASLYHNKVIIGIDAHAPEHILDEDMFSDARSFLEKLDIEIVTEIPLRTYDL